MFCILFVTRSEITFTNNYKRRPNYGVLGLLNGFPRDCYPRFTIQNDCKLWQRKIIGAFGKLRKATISFVMFVRPSDRPSVCMEQIQGRLKSNKNKNNGRFKTDVTTLVTNVTTVTFVPRLPKFPWLLWLPLLSDLPMFPGC
jgi:hypothetical protein